MAIFGGQKNQTDPVTLAQQQRQREQQEVDSSFKQGIS